MSDKSSHGVFFLDLLLFVDITNHFLWSDYTIAKHRLQVGILSKKEFAIFKYEIERILTNDQVNKYFYNLYHFAKKFKTPMTFSFLFEYGEKHNKFEKDFYDKNSPKYKKSKYLNF